MANTRQVGMGHAGTVRLRPGAVVGDYRLLRIVRRDEHGGYFAEARHEGTKDMVALKVVPSSLDPEAAKAATDQLGARIGGIRNPHLIPIHERGYVEPWGFEASAPMSAAFMADSLQMGEKFTPVEALRIATDIATGLQALHEMGTCHGDISPDTVVLARQNRARLLAAGLYAALNPPLNGAATTDPRPGSPYAAPERARLGPTAAGDLYSLGLVLYELLTGRQAAATVAGYSPGQRDSQAPRPPAPFSEVAPKLPRALGILTFSLLQGKPEDRCASAAEFRARVRQIVQASQRRTTPPTKQ